ncbi:MAG: NAD(P)/FAD-dependent oxidoreductase [Pseudoflavonifractor sp.]|nr:NAD(P)/FAD-dependent oxidoreductase [Pseudoflavonifractor sp.]
MSSFDVIVIGGGASGCMAALSAASCGVSVLLMERNPKIGRKLYITGKGRCNVTNRCSVQECLSSIPHNARFLTSAMTRFPPEEAVAFFEELGVPLKTERGNRVFPQSDRAVDVIDALLRALRKNRVELVQDRAAALDLADGAVVGVTGEHGKHYACRTVVLATGGVSYPATGSTGDGYGLARSAGHTIQPPKGSLVPWEAAGCAELQGLALKNVELTVKNSHKKVLFQEQGELLFTHFGLSGPLVLSASAHTRDFEGERYTAVIDLKPALDEETLDRRLVRELTDGANRDLRHVMETLEPRSLVPVLLARAGLSGEEKAHSVTRTQRRSLLEKIKGLDFHLSGPRPVEEAIVTAGGVTVREVSPGDMASKKTRGLYLAGELLDVDAYTGGFNLQIAWSTGRAAGLGAAEFCREETSAHGI